jgi:hypothetical protein
MSEPAEDKETAKLMDVWSTSDVSKSDEVFEKWDKEKAAKEKNELDQA